jgi:hypothetical protein
MRKAPVRIGGKDYEMILTTCNKRNRKSTAAVEPRRKTYEGRKLRDGPRQIVWLITLLVNQSVLVHNLQNPDDKMEQLSEEAVELLTSPFELAEYKNAIMNAMFKGAKRNVVSEEDSSKNAEVG